MNRKEYSPVFIIGCNRSGTSLLRAMLNNHPDLAIVFESIFLLDYINAKKDIDIKLQKKILLKEPMIGEWRLRLEEDIKKVKTTEELFRVVHEAYAKNRGKKRWGNKTPRFTRYSFKIKKIIPEAIFIHLIRDPRAVSLSLAESRAHKSNIYFGALRWKRHVGIALELEKKYKDDVLRIYYEELVKYPKKTLEKICAFMNISFNSKMLSYSEGSLKEFNKYHKNILKNLANELDASLVDKWRSKLTKSEIQLVEEITKKEMLRTGYGPIFSPRRVGLWEKNIYRGKRMIGFINQVLYYLFYWPKYLFYTLYRKVIFGTFFDEIRGINY